MGRRSHCAHRVRVAKPGGKQGFAGVGARWVEWSVCQGFAVQFGVSGGGFLQVATGASLTAGGRLRAPLICSLEGFFVARQLIFADKGAVANGLCEVVAQGIGIDVFEQHGGR